MGEQLSGPSSVAVYVQAVTLLCVTLSFFSELGWYSMQLNKSTGYYVSPLKSCLYTTSYCTQFQDYVNGRLCQPTRSFYRHAYTKESAEKSDESEASMDASTEEVKLVARFILCLAFLALFLLVLDFLSYNCYRLVRVNLAVLMAALMLSQFCFQMRMFTAMNAMMQLLQDNVQKNQKDHFDKPNHVTRELTMGFYLNVFGTILCVTSFTCSLYRVVNMLMQGTDSAVKRVEKSRNLPRYISKPHKKGYEKIEEKESATSKFNGLLISGSEHA